MQSGSMALRRAFALACFPPSLAELRPDLTVNCMPALATCRTRAGLRYAVRSLERLVTPYRSSFTPKSSGHTVWFLG